jgi:hypothetical protein
VRDERGSQMKPRETAARPRPGRPASRRPRPGADRGQGPRLVLEALRRRASPRFSAQTSVAPRITMAAHAMTVPMRTALASALPERLSAQAQPLERLPSETSGPGVRKQAGSGVPPKVPGGRCRRAGQASMLGLHDPARAVSSRDIPRRRLARPRHADARRRGPGARPAGARVAHARRRPRPHAALAARADHHRERGAAPDGLDLQHPGRADGRPLADPVQPDRRRRRPLRDVGRPEPSRSRRPRV